ncbi:ATP-dependent DNA helicase [Cytobacillus sp. IB215665]|uniref:ATP-dependent DNA helicase n=1 Tax=Cytobacillus sp. IB215665 TaxID=3097357 RepID=UPI002A112CE8|nr:ATP-dependent DNA helicase [Cytobacillus sp. IB215665]MDX8366501.1 ATP-dependent DNA helicase [Cytobacillus sp. IB215665]
MIRERLPFQVLTNDNFFDKLNEWIGDVFYDILPEAGLELRDEQIFMAFQLERAFKEKKIILAEAGVGTGKTIVYLLYALCYARYTNKPAIISCADESLIEQLVKEEGDIAKLRKLLNINIDVRLAKSPEQYLCLNKLDDAMTFSEHDNINDVYDSLPKFVNNHAALQQFTPYGDRKQYPLLSDEEWNMISWDVFQDCSSCEKRHRCGQILSRDHYRKAADLIICSHDFYMEHVWTKESRKREGQLPLLPEYSSVVFDEGHLLEIAAQKALTYKIKATLLEGLLTRLLENEIREELALLIEETIETNQLFFDSIVEQAVQVQGSHRMNLALSDSIINYAKQLNEKLIAIGDALVFESETYTIEEYQLNIVDEYIDQVQYSLQLMVENDEAITWVEANDDETTVVIMPKSVENVLEEKVFSNNIPFVFSSATLSNNQSFEYVTASLGIRDYLSFSVESPFDYDEQMKIKMPILTANDNLFQQKFTYTLKELQKTNGRALILFNSKHDLQLFKEHCSEQTEFSFLFEGDREISELVSIFQNEEHTILCAQHLWEGLDIPGPALSNLIIWSLPYPPNDPVFNAKRKASENPFWSIDVPYMMLRLRQGVGRLVRSHHDKGVVTIFCTSDIDKELIAKVETNLPTNVTKS